MSLKSFYFSSLGKSLSDKFTIRKNNSKKKVGRNLFIPDKNWKMKNYFYDDEQVKEECNFNINELKKRIKINNRAEKENKNNKKNRKEENKIYKKIFQGNNYQYHNNHIAKIENLKKRGLLKKTQPQLFANFLPKYEYLYNKIITGPKWENQSNRNKNMFNAQRHITNLSYNDSDYFKDNIKGFVDMSKQTKRKPMIETPENKLDLEKINFGFNTSRNNRSKEDHPILLVFSKSNNDSSETIKTENTKEKEKEKFKFVPDFNRYMSRDQINKVKKIKNNERITNGEIFPNYHSIEIGPKIMVSYDTNHNHKLKDNRYNLTFFSYKNKNFAPHKVFEKIYGNKLKASPNFEKMISRQKNELPFFLNGITNRNICVTNTDKSLKMNNYTNSKMYDLREDLNKNTNKYKNEKLKEMRKCLSFENLNLYKRDKYLYQLDNKIKKFNGIFSVLKE